MRSDAHADEMPPQAAAARSDEPAPHIQAHATTDHGAGARIDNTAPATRSAVLT
jgi:hypothetical protein